MKRHRYLLGDSARESARLRAQARLWDPVAEALFDRLKVRPGWRVLELGPGQGSLHASLRRRARGPVDAVEPSEVNAARVSEIARRDGLGEGRLWRAPLEDAALPDKTYDLIFARWVFLFLKDPGARIRQLARALKPGGLLAISDYHRQTMSMAPLPADWGDFLEADMNFFADEGGDASVGGKLPALFRAAGLSVVSVTPTVKTGGPGSPVWEWATGFFMGVMDRYARVPPLTPAKARRLAREWKAAARRPESVLFAPAVLEVVGRRPR